MSSPASPTAPEPAPATSRAFALIVLMLAAAVLGLAPVFVRLTETGPAAAGFWRLLFALPLLLAFVGRPASMGGTGVGRPGKWMALAGMFFALDMSFWHYGLHLTSVANATVLCNLTPVVVTLFAWVVLRQKPKSLFLVALALSMVGAAAMALGANHSGGADRSLLGDALSLSVTVWYAAYFLTIQAARKTASAQRVMLWSTAVGAPLMLLAALIMGEQIIPTGPAGWAACIGLGLVHVAGQGGVAWALGKLPATITAVTILVQPVVAGLVSWWAFGETLTPVQALGGALVLAAIVLAQWSTRKTPSSQDGAQTKTGAASGESAPVNP